MKESEVRVRRMQRLEESNFLIEASHILNESYEDADVTEDEHEELFAIFKEQVDEVMPDPTSSEKSHIRQILITRHSKSI